QATRDRQESASISVRGIPFAVIVPAVARSAPMITDSSVDLPDPERPDTTSQPPARTDPLAPRNTDPSVPGYAAATPLSTSSRTGTGAGAVPVETGSGCAASGETRRETSLRAG